MALTLIVDDDADAAEMLAAQLAERGHAVVVAHSLRDARRQLAVQPTELVLLDLRLPDGHGLALFDEPALAQASVVLMTGYATLETAVQALRLGALDYLIKPVTAEQLDAVLQRVLPVPSAEARSDWRQQVDASGRFGHLVGRAPCMQRIYQQIARVAQTGVTVLVTGESGTGKELVARTLHDESRRRERPFLAVNCGAISPQLMESEIFGHEKGSFTGADRQHQGFFERADGGTLFLDEVTEMPLELQVKLLRVLETGSFMRVGSTTLRQTDVRIVAATNRDPWQAVEQGQLREDLLYRLNVFPIALPPLRERLEDLGLLCTHFLLEIGQREGQAKRLSPAGLDKLADYRWPGNVRELRNVLQRVYVMSEGDTITTEWLPSNGPARAPAMALGGDPDLRVALGTPLADVEQRLILQTLRHYGNHRERTAAALGVSLKTLYNKLKTYESEPP
ncbi:sigma-54-dependent transcriptional regulator [Pseudorhodoferax soli]|uniref:DNA-binding NtrC family response regulator n=1 Tax=Pseudorhodoferax soli TaxID=545864 RepID=A0A368XX00_9BURK|nr:sigma-54 dependent transcriptional regulator [Pseudorhodoferax soli]RCW72492.1 DNA-binding NtrC family response regulator [Pseudorhodoferax soli]